MVKEYAAGDTVWWVNSYHRVIRCEISAAHRFLEGQSLILEFPTCGGVTGRVNLLLQGGSIFDTEAAAEKAAKKWKARESAL